LFLQQAVQAGQALKAVYKLKPNLLKFPGITVKHLVRFVWWINFTYFELWFSNLGFKL